ncbi:hypothetical protein DMH04_19920 [Kibdelosporangium aridum]|uniref:Uncharacterized protein n=1 Tax=Kibdelosporangium aridum TaxID=2030 RepID=A0A428Z9U0_KIBAR|nr:hypothetical protein DMH04_19920 [Kibdelosporangium aridum]
MRRLLGLRGLFGLPFVMSMSGLSSCSLIGVIRWFLSLIRFLRWILMMIMVLFGSMVLWFGIGLVLMVLVNGNLLVLTSGSI